MQELLLDFRKELQNLGYSESVYNYFPKQVRLLLEFTQENPQNITDTHLRDYYNYLLQKPNRHGTMSSQSHIYKQLLAIQLFFNYLQRIALIAENPYNLKIKRVKAPPRTILSQQQIQLLYKSAQTIEQTVLLHLCYGCGLRRVEALNLSVKDIDFEQRKLFVRQGKGQKRRVLPLTEKIAKDLKKYYTQSQGYRNSKTTHFLIHYKGYPMSYSKIYSLFKALLKQAQKKEPIPTICLHALRHSIATHLLENEMSIEMVRDFLGHKFLDTTEIYTRVNYFKMKV
jgi:integrase/recombinase XerD